MLLQSVLKLLIEKVDGKNPGVMIPIPQYPLYSASLAEFSIDQVHLSILSVQLMLTVWNMRWVTSVVSVCRSATT